VVKKDRRWHVHLYFMGGVAAGVYALLLGHPIIWGSVSVALFILAGIFA